MYLTVRRKPRMSRKSASSFLAVTPLFDVDTHSAKHLRQFKYTSLSLIPSLLDSEEFVSKVSNQLCLIDKTSETDLFVNKSSF